MNAPAFALTGAPAAIPSDPQYLRLFGLIPPALAITATPSRPLGGDGDTGSPALPCDPTGPESQLVFDALAHIGHPSAAALASIAQLRLRHMEKGHTPAADAAHGPLYFKHKADDAWRDALAARSPEKRRQLLIVAAAILIAMIDAEDFARAQQEPTP